MHAVGWIRSCLKTSLRPRCPDEVITQVTMTGAKPTKPNRPSPHGVEVSLRHASALGKETLRSISYLRSA